MALGQVPNRCTTGCLYISESRCVPQSHTWNSREQRLMDSSEFPRCLPRHPLNLLHVLDPLGTYRPLCWGTVLRTIYRKHYLKNPFFSLFLNFKYFPIMKIYIFRFMHYIEKKKKNWHSTQLSLVVGLGYLAGGIKILHMYIKGYRKSFPQIPFG